MPTDPAIRRLLWFFAIVYAVEGIGQAKSGIIWQPLIHFLKVTQDWNALEVSAALAVVDLPWVVKPLYGILSDFVPLFGYRRRSYLLLANGAAVLAFAALATISDPAALVPVLVVTAVAMAVSSTICGALLVESGQRHGASAAFVNQQWLWFNAALMGASVVGGFLADVLAPVDALHVACWIAAAAPIAVLPSLRLVDEAPARLRRAALRRQLTALLSALRLRSLWFVALFLFAYYFNPGLGTPLYYDLSDRLGFSQSFIGVLATVNAAGWIIGGLLYRWLLTRLTTGALLRLGIAAGTISTLCYLALVDAPTAVAVYLLAGIAGMIANVATLSLAAERCPRGAEGFVFAALMSVINLAVPASDALGSALYEHVFHRALAPLIVISAALTAGVFLLLPLVELRVPAQPLSAPDATAPPPPDP